MTTGLLLDGVGEQEEQSQLARDQHEDLAVHGARWTFAAPSNASSDERS